MLREIINFTNSLSQECITRNLEPLEGLHIMVELDENGVAESIQYELFRKGGEITKFLKVCLERQVCTSCVSSDKRLDAPKKMNYSCSPFCVAFTKDVFHKNLSKVNLKDYFAKLQQKLLVYCDTEPQKRYSDLFLKACANELVDYVKNLPEYPNLRKNDFIYIYLGNLKPNDYENTHKHYLAEKSFNTDKYNEPFGDEIYGVPDYLTTYNPDKKPFLRHHTATFTINTRVSSRESITLFRFLQLVSNSRIPNPLPIFIERKELNEEVISIFNRDRDRKIGYSEIIREIYQREGDLGNYYLLNLRGKKQVNDFDFVSSFQYRIEPSISIVEIISLGGQLSRLSIKTIFDFEKEIVGKIFNGGLVNIYQDKFEVFYFFDFEDKANRKRTTSIKRRTGDIAFQLVRKYRKAFYDYIYKSKHNALNSRIFHEILSNIICDEIRHDKLQNGKHTKEYSIKEKLNIWFSLFEYFDQQENEGGDESMANQILKLQERMQKIANNNDAHVENDHEFAYATGQVIYYLLNQSEAGNKSHALLEPFLQKTDATQLKMAISRTFAQYKHAITFYKGRFEKLMAEVLSYDLDGDLKSLLPITLAGYFSDCVIYQKNRRDNQNVGD